MRNWLIVATITRTDFAAPPFRLEFDRLPVTVGAAIENDIVLDEGHVSGTHAHIAMSRGSLILHNSSRNGTFVNGNRVDTTVLTSTDVISIPPFELRFELQIYGDDAAYPDGTVVATLPTFETEISQTRRSVPATPPPAPLPAPEKRLLLTIVRSPTQDLGRSVELAAAGMRLGRSADAEVSINCPTLSRMHAEIRRIGKDWQISDLKSANGTFVNGKEIKQAPLRPGDEITLGEDVTIRISEAGTGEVALPLRKSKRGVPTVVDDTLPTSAAEEVRASKAAAPSKVMPTQYQRTPSPPEPVPQLPVYPPQEPAVPNRPKGKPSTPARSLQLRSTRAAWNPKVLVLALDGWVDSYNYTEVGTTMDRIVDAGEKYVVVDVTNLAYIDHTGLGVLMKSITSVERYGGTIRILGATQRLLDTISLSRLDVFLKGKLLQDERAAQREFARV
ncbi:MAG TPA: FHA domain-containing protein [Thermoanaerobaculia bacterium]|nr:FHA domain-containing protein [Thermoanaerobaculia bacterium]